MKKKKYETKSRTTRNPIHRTEKYMYYNVYGVKPIIPTNTYAVRTTNYTMYTRLLYDRAEMETCWITRCFDTAMIIIILLLRLRLTTGTPSLARISIFSFLYLFFFPTNKRILKVWIISTTVKKNKVPYR